MAAGSAAGRARGGEPLRRGGRVAGRRSAARACRRLLQAPVRSGGRQVPVPCARARGSSSRGRGQEGDGTGVGRSANAGERCGASPRQVCAGGARGTRAGTSRAAGCAARLWARVPTLTVAATGICLRGDEADQARRSRRGRAPQCRRHRWPERASERRQALWPHAQPDSLSSSQLLRRGAAGACGGAPSPAAPCLTHRAHSRCRQLQHATASLSATDSQNFAICCTCAYLAYPITDLLGLMLPWHLATLQDLADFRCA